MDCCFTLYSVFPWRMVDLLFVAAFSWKSWVDDWHHSEAMALLELCVLNWDFTDSQPAVISLIWVQRGVTKGLHLVSGLRLPPPFSTPVLSSPATHHPYYYHLWYYYSLKLPKIRHNLGSRKLYTHTMIANRWMNNWCKFCLHSLWHWKLSHMIT